jgi:alpha-tubulin suppressor-like RCC1 family protein
MWSWGYNSSGQLGLGNITSYSSPKQIGALTSWLNVAGGYRFCTATQSNGTLWTWGSNNFGQLGLGNSVNKSSPNQVGSLTTWLSSACGHYFTVATLY